MAAGLRVHGHPAKSPSLGCELGVMSSGIAGSAPDPQVLLYCRSRSVRYADSPRWQGGGTAAAPLGRGPAFRSRCVGMGDGTTAAQGRHYGVKLV